MNRNNVIKLMGACIFGLIGICLMVFGMIGGSRSLMHYIGVSAFVIAFYEATRLAFSMLYQYITASPVNKVDSGADSD